MAALLGGQFCMESLQSDISDLQAAVNDVFSRVGPVRYPSWKYPDKMSCDLDIEDLLQLHSYSPDLSEEERQVSHIILYELVIERLVLLIQGMSKFMETLLLQGKCPVGVDPPSNTSVGLVVKKYWKRLVQVHTLCTQLNSECKRKEQKITQLQLSKDENRMSEKSGRCESCERLSTLSGLIPANDSLGSPISRDCCNKSSQTLETAFVPCESCYYVQKNFRDSGDSVISMCQSQGLPSSLQKFKPHVADNDWLTANEVNQWTSEQMKDLNRINKHLDQLALTAESLKSDVDQANRKCEKLQTKVQSADKEVKMEKETQRGMSLQFEAEVTSLKSKHTEALCLVEEEKTRLEKHSIEMETQLSKYKDELTGQKNLLEKLKESQGELEKELKAAQTQANCVQSLQTTVDKLTSDLNQVTSELEIKAKQLTKEQSKNQSAAKHSQSLQTKQGSLLRRLEEVSQENEELQSQLSELEETKEGLEETLHSTKQQLTEAEKKMKEDQVMINRLQNENSEIQKSVSETEKCLQEMKNKLEEVRENNRLLVEYPDLNGPVNQNVQGSGDIVQDLENQIEANSLRIRLLEEQNDSFRNSVKKMLLSRENEHQRPQPVPLWNPHTVQSGSSELTVQYKTAWSVPQAADDVSANHVGPKSKTTQNKSKTDDEFLIGHVERPGSNSRRRTALSSHRPPSGKIGHKGPPPSNYNTGLAAYKQLKNAGKISTAPSQTYSRGDSRAEISDRRESYTCDLCDKMYTKLRDLEIHKSYCTG